MCRSEHIPWKVGQYLSIAYADQNKPMEGRDAISCSAEEETNTKGWPCTPVERQVTCTPWKDCETPFCGDTCIPRTMSAYRIGR